MQLTDRPSERAGATAFISTKTISGFTIGAVTERATPGEAYDRMGAPQTAVGVQTSQSKAHSTRETFLPQPKIVEKPYPINDLERKPTKF
jgi:hypothetical protein